MVCVKNQSQVVVDTSLLYVHILPETREKQTARNVGGNYKKHLFWFVFVTRLRSILTVSGMPAVTPTERGTCRHLSGCVWTLQLPCGAGGAVCELQRAAHRLQPGKIVQSEKSLFQMQSWTAALA